MPPATMDAAAQDKWDDYTKARNTMLTATNTDIAPWVCVRANHKKKAHKAVLRHVLRVLAPEEVAKTVEAPDAEVLFPFEAKALKDGRLER